MYTLEQIKNFTPIERNEFIDEILKYIENNYRLIHYFFVEKTDYNDNHNELYFYYVYANIPIGNIDFNIINHTEVISFLKSIKTAE
mgnify:CR=1 FL=1